MCPLICPAVLRGSPEICPGMGWMATLVDKGCPRWIGGDCFIWELGRVCFLVCHRYQGQLRVPKMLHCASTSQSPRQQQQMGQDNLERWRDWLSPAGCISQSIHPVSISLNSHPWCLSQPHPQNQYQYLTTPIPRRPPPRLAPSARAAKTIPANPRRWGAHPLVLLARGAGAPGVAVLQGHQVPLQGRHCPSAGHHYPAAAACPAALPLLLQAALVTRALLEKGQPPLKQCMSSASYSPVRREVPALAWVVSRLRTWAGKWKFVVLHMRNVWHSQLWFLPCQPGESFIITCIKHKCSLVYFEGGTQSTIYFPVTGSHGNDVPKYLWGRTRSE